MVTIVYSLIKELFLSVLGKVAFKAILERFFTRLIVYGLEKLKDMSTNQVVDDTVQDIIVSLSGKGLYIIDNKEVV